MRDSLEDGHVLRPVVAPRPIGIMLGLNGSQNPFQAQKHTVPLSIFLLDRVEAMSQPNIKAQILLDDPVEESTFPLIHRISFDKMFRLGSPANYTPAPNDSIAAMAQNAGVSPQEMAYDILIENQGYGFIYSP